jgi:light-regulated signal transduction histidine kinase (bacteriophytochrome)
MTPVMDRMIDDILTLSSIGTTELEKTTIPMSRMLKEIVFEVQSKYSTFPLITFKKLWPVKADYNMLRQAWVILVANAFRFTLKKENPEIEIGSILEDNEIVYYISDNGVGFDMNGSGKHIGILKKLHRIDEFDGAGIGLSIVKRILARHGGRVWAVSAVGQGSTFFISLPE